MLQLPFAPFSHECAHEISIYRRLNDAQQKNRKSLVEAENSSDGDENIPRSQSGISVRSRRSIPSQKSASRNSVDEESMLIAAELHDLPEGSESGDSETATEVDVRYSGGLFVNCVTILKILSCKYF